MDKEKGKSQPFAGYLQADEEVLWQYAYQVPKRWPPDVFAPYSIITFGGMIGGLSLISALNVTTIFGILIAFLIPLLALMGLYYLRCRYRQKMQTFITGGLAVTNQRLLNRQDETFLEIDLEDVPSIGISVGTKRGTEDFSLLYFGDSFPAWAYVPQARRVKNIIEDAQQQRMQKYEG